MDIKKIKINDLKLLNIYKLKTKNKETMPCKSIEWFAKMRQFKVDVYILGYRKCGPYRAHRKHMIKAKSRVALMQELQDIETILGKKQIFVKEMMPCQDLKEKNPKKKI